MSGAAGQARLKRLLPRVATLTVLVATAATLVITVPGRFHQDPLLQSPQENSRLQLALDWIEQGRPAHPLPAYSRLPSDVAPALLPRDAALVGDEVVPKDFPYALGLVALLALVDARLPAATSLLASLALVAATAAVAVRVSGSPWSGPLAAVVLVSTATFLSGSTGLVTTGAATACAVMVGLLALVPRRTRSSGAAPSGTERGLPRSDVLAGLAFGLAVGLHHDVVLFVAGIVAAVGMHRYGGRPGRSVAVTAGMAVALLPVMLYNAWLFDSPVRTGYAAGEQFFDRFMIGHRAGILDLRPELLAAHVELYVARPEVVLLLAGAALVVAGARRSTSPEQTGAAWRKTTRLLAAGVLLGGVPYLAFAGARPLFGGEAFHLGGSFLRYGLVVMAPVAALAAACLSVPDARLRRLSLAALSGSVLLGSSTAWSAPGGLVHQHELASREGTTRHRELAVTMESAVVVTARHDKYLWPQRRTLVAAYLVRHPDEAVRHGEGLYDVAPTAARLGDVLVRLVGCGWPVTIVDDGWVVDRQVLEETLERAGLHRQKTTVPTVTHIRPVPGAAARAVPGAGGCGRRDADGGAGRRAAG